MKLQSLPRQKARFRYTEKFSVVILSEFPRLAHQKGYRPYGIPRSGFCPEQSTAFSQ